MDYKNTKIWIGDDPIKEKQIQEFLFSKGINWGTYNRIERGTGALYIDSNNRLSYSGPGSRAFFESHKYTEIIITPELNENGDYW